MVRILLDANVYFSGILSPQGGSGYILALAQKRKFFSLVISPYALAEAVKNIREKISQSHTSELEAIL